MRSLAQQYKLSTFISRIIKTSPLTESWQERNILIKSFTYMLNTFICLVTLLVLFNPTTQTNLVICG
jgi:hypothetical protein